MPAEKMKKVIAVMRDVITEAEVDLTGGTEDARVKDFCDAMYNCVNYLEGIHPDSRALSEMAEEDRASSLRMRCTVGGAPKSNYSGIIIDPECAPGLACVVSWGGVARVAPWEEVTPLTSLPRLEQLSDTLPKIPADKQAPLAVNNVILSGGDPRVGDLPVGTTLLDRDGKRVTKGAAENGWGGTGINPSDRPACGPWVIKFIPRGK